MTARDTRFVNGAQRLSQRIRTIRTTLALPVLTEEIGGLLLRRTKDRFRAEVDPDRKPWKPLAESTVRSRIRLGYGAGPKLRRTDALLDAIRVIRGNNSGAVYTNTGAGIRIGVEGKESMKAYVQNNGFGHVPARRFLGIGALDVKSVDSFLRRKGQQAVG